MVKPLARRRAKQTLDTSRMAAAVSRPGIDPRTWVCLGTVTEVGFDNGLVVAVMITEGALAGEEVACDVLSPFASVLATASAPLEVGDTVLLACLQGDANTMPIVLGALHTPSTRAPVLVNGRELDAKLAGSAIVVSNGAADAEIAVKNLRITAETIKVGPTADPQQPFVRGRAFIDALDDWLEATSKLIGLPAPPSGLLGAFTLLSAAAVGPLAALKPGFDAANLALGLWKKSVAQLRVHLVEGDALSTSIKGE